MPKRQGAVILKRVRQVTKSKDEQIQEREEKLIEVAQMGAYYNKLRSDAKSITDDMDTKKVSILEFCDTNALFEKNGKHKEINAPLGDGKTVVFIQLQQKETVTYVDNVIQLLRDKLGEEAENWIVKVPATERVHETALEQLFNTGKITEMEVEELTQTKKSESFVLKVIDTTAPKASSKKKK